jgi:hypothetical protein
MSDRRARFGWNDRIEREREDLEAQFRAISEQKTTARDRALDALQVAIEHFEVLGVSREALAPLLEIGDAFCEGERGLLHPLFEPDAKPGRPRRFEAEVQQQRCAALAMEAFMRAGERREQAAKKVAKVLKDIGYKFPPNSKAEWRTVAEIRDSINRTLAVKGGESEFYDFYWLDRRWLNQALDEEQKDPAELANLILGWLKAMRL